MGSQHVFLLFVVATSLACESENPDEGPGEPGAGETEVALREACAGHHALAGSTEWTVDEVAVVRLVNCTGFDLSIVRVKIDDFGYTPRLSHVGDGVTLPSEESPMPGRIPNSAQFEVRVDMPPSEYATPPGGRLEFAVKSIDGDPAFFQNVVVDVFRDR